MDKAFNQINGILDKQAELDLIGLLGLSGLNVKSVNFNLIPNNAESILVNVDIQLTAKQVDVLKDVLNKYLLNKM